MRLSFRKLGLWLLWGSAAAALVIACYASVFFLPYPLFPNHAEFDGFSVYSDGQIREGFDAVIADAQRRISAMEHYREDRNLRIFLCYSQRKFIVLNRLAGKRHAGQALVISAAGNVFLSVHGIEAVGLRNGGHPVHSRLEGSLAAAIAHEFAHALMAAEVGNRESRRIPPWKSEGLADFMANRVPAASDPGYDFADRITYLLDDDHWRPPVTAFDRRHFRWHLLVEYLFTVRGIGFDELLDDHITENDVWSEMMTWYTEVENQ